MRSNCIINGNFKIKNDIYVTIIIICESIFVYNRTIQEPFLFTAILVTLRETVAQNAWGVFPSCCRIGWIPIFVLVKLTHNTQIWCWPRIQPSRTVKKNHKSLKQGGTPPHQMNVPRIVTKKNKLV